MYWSCDCLHAGTKSFNLNGFSRRFENFWTFSILVHSCIPEMEFDNIACLYMKRPSFSSLTVTPKFTRTPSPSLTMAGGEGDQITYCWLERRKGMGVLLCHINALLWNGTSNKNALKRKRSTNLNSCLFDHGAVTIDDKSMNWMSSIHIRKRIMLDVYFGWQLPWHPPMLKKLDSDVMVAVKISGADLTI